jgi:predicted AAA+ superfamily ATPase
MADIIETLKDSNYWWKEEFILQYHKRNILSQLSRYIPLPQIIALTGLRRVGKTTLMQKIAYDYIKNGFDVKKIIYFSFDEFREIEIRDVLKAYEVIMEKNLRKDRYLLLLDEIQKLINWEDQLKRVYDIYGQNIKIIISGSGSLFIKKKSRETLSGRIFEFKIDLLSFEEFLRFKGVDVQPIGLYEKELTGFFREYQFSLGFPELVGIKDKQIILKYIKESILEKVIYRDIPQLFKIKDITVLGSLLEIIIDRPGQLIEITGLAKELNLSRQTLSSYLIYLEESFLLRKLYNYSNNKRKSERKLKKYYPSILLDIIFKNDDLSRSKVFEWIIVHQLDGEFFWRDSYKNEVDIIIAKNRPVPIEIKYGKINTKGLLAFMKKFDVDTGYIISYDREEQLIVDHYTIEIIPAYKFLLQIDKKVFD